MSELSAFEKLQLKRKLEREAAAEAARAAATRPAMPAAAISTSMLSVEVRRMLHEIGWTRLRQSEIGQGRWCPKSIELKLARDNALQRQNYNTVPKFMGSVFHRALYLSDETIKYGRSQHFWMTLLQEQQASDPLPGMREEVNLQLRRFASLLTSVETWGIEAVDLIAKLIQRFKAMSWVLKEQEVYLEYVDGINSDGSDDGYPVVFYGTLDMVIETGMGLLIMDPKTTGMWAKFSGDSSSIKKADYSEEHIRVHAQLNHYYWLYAQTRRVLPAGFGLVFPVNAIPLLKDGKNASKGEDRGTLAAPVYVPRQRRAWTAASYRDELAAMITSWIRGGFYPARPSSYGKSDCPSCDFFNHCVGGSPDGAPVSSYRLFHAMEKL